MQTAARGLRTLLVDKQNPVYEAVAFDVLHVVREPAGPRAERLREAIMAAEFGGGMRGNGSPSGIGVVVARDRRPSYDWRASQGATQVLSLSPRAVKEEMRRVADVRPKAYHGAHGTHNTEETRRVLEALDAVYV